MSRSVDSLVGRDFGRAAILKSSTRRFVPMLLVGLLVAGLGLAALRVDLIRIRYALATALREEKVLLEEQRSLTAQVRSLRDPTRLGEIARKRGFVRPERVIELTMGPADTRR